MISMKVDCNLDKLTSRLQGFKNILNRGLLDKYGKIGVDALSSATPKDTGLASKSWYYRIVEKHNSIRIEWCNSDIEDGSPVAVVLQYGHATKSGTYIEGIDYINPAMKPVFKKIVKEIDGEVRSR